MVSASAIHNPFAPWSVSSQLPKIQDFHYHEISFKPDQLREAHWALHGMSLACAHIVDLFAHLDAFGYALRVYPAVLIAIKLGAFSKHDEVSSTHFGPSVSNCLGQGMQSHRYCQSTYEAALQLHAG